MKAVIAAAAVLLALSSSVIEAACYRFEKAPNDVFVCVKGDSFENRKQAKSICDKVSAKDCGNVSSYSSSCHSNSDKCYDENSKPHRDLSGY